MKFVIAKDQLVTGLQTVQNVVGSRTTLPILSNVLLQAGEGKVQLTATDLDVTIACTVTATVEAPGWITLPVKRLFEIVRELPAMEVDLELQDKNVVALRSGASFYRMNGLPAEEFPPRPIIEAPGALRYAQERMKVMLRRTAYAASTDESRYVLNGLFFSLKDHKFTMVATDGRRLALADEEMEIDPGAQAEFIIPTKAINELARLLQDKGEVEIRLAGNQVALHLTAEPGQDILIVSKLVEGNYPNYRQVIPASSAERIPLVREELHQALRRADIMTSERSKSVKLSFTQNQLSITANTPEVGEARETLAINYRGKDVAIAFNPVYLMDPLKALDVDEVFLEVTDELSPGLLKINGPFLYVIMPMRMS
jgi:DNA polymerase-3 subunit beta